MTNLSAHYTLGQFQGLIELVEKGLITPASFIDSCIRVRNEYQASKEAPEAPYIAQAKQIAKSYNNLAKREGLEDANEQY